MKIDAQIEHEEFLASLLEQESSFLMKSCKTFHWTILWVRHIEGIHFRMCQIIF